MNNEQRVADNDEYERDNQENINRQARLNAMPARQDAIARQVAQLQARLQRLENDGNIRHGINENMPPEEGMDPEVDFGGRRNKMSMRQKFMNKISMFKKSMSKRYKNTKHKMSKRKSRRL
jgi:hypothetical protein